DRERLARARDGLAHALDLLLDAALRDARARRVRAAAIEDPERADGHPGTRGDPLEHRPLAHRSSWNRSRISAPIRSTACSAPGPSARTTSSAPFCPQRSRTPITLFASARWPSFSTVTTHSNSLARRTSF